MLWYTHVMAGAAAGMLAGGNAGPKSALLAAGISGFAALLPDVDSPASVLGRRVPVLSWGAKIAVGHRQIFHSLLAAAVVSWLLSLIPAMRSCFWLLFFGYTSHLLLDALNPEGVPLLWPLPWRASLPLTETGGFIERFVLTPVSTLMFCVAAVCHFF